MTKVAVVGCGPSGMFFLHAAAIRRQRLEEKGDTVALDKLPSVTCFERSSSPGGLWSSDRISSPGRGSPTHVSGVGERSANMYEALWTNGPKECLEFSDYTMDEHFGCALPMYVPRALVLDYMLARCTRNNPNFFDSVKFNTSVKSVTFREDLGKFVIRTVDHGDCDRVTESLFDKCIWAAGGNGKPSIPAAIDQALSSGGFAGRVMHSSETGPDFDDCVRGKKILVIGDSYSAEDLTLQAIKLGVKSVDMCTRSGVGIAYYTGSWPRDCVKMHYAYAPTGVASDGRGIEMSNGSEVMTLSDIETVIYCTGYEHNMKMLDPSLRPDVKGPYFSDYDIPKDWKMPNNDLSKEFGDIPIGKIIYPPFVRHDMYRGRLLSNPNMMFFFERTDVPLMDLDITAWLLLAQIMGDIPLPALDEVKKFNLNTMLEAMKDPIWRVDCEENYRDRWWKIDENHWTYDMSDKRMEKMELASLDLQYRLLARDMIDAGYPFQIGTFEKLGENGKALASFNLVCGYARYDLDKESPDASWKTFRDCDPSKCYSIMTGTVAAPLKCRWLDLNGDSKDDIVDTSKKSNKKGKRGWSFGGMFRDKLRMH